MTLLATPEPRYGVLIARDVMVPMRDGVRLASDVWRPAIDGEPAPGRFPAIVIRTPYDKTHPGRWPVADAEFFVPHGYVVIAQDCRGRYNSEGTGQYHHGATPTEGVDGFDTVEWAAAQQWCTGRIGMSGTSYGALVQTHAALYRPPHLAALWPDVGHTNSYHHTARTGGAMQQQMFGALFVHALNAHEIAGDDEARDRVISDMERMRQLVWEAPFQPGQTALAAVPALEQVMLDYYRRGAYDEFWALEPNDFEQHFHRHADVPMTLSGGWYDPFALSTTTYFAEMSRNSAIQHLVMGPWNHDGMRQGISYAADVDFGPASVWGYPTYNDVRLRWFDRWLKDLENGVENDPPVRYFLMGGGSGRRSALGKLEHGGAWCSERAWPPQTTPLTLHLRLDGELALEPGGPGSLAYRFDPADPVPTIAAQVTGFEELVPVPEGVDPRYLPLMGRMRSIIPPGAADQRQWPDLVASTGDGAPLADRQDVLVFRTEPLREEVILVGRPEARLWVSSSALDTDVTVKVLDVYPPSADYPEGYALNLVDSVLRLRFREGWADERLLEPGVVYSVAILLPPTANRFAASHQIRVDISSSNFPRFDVNPNTGEPIGRHTRVEVATNTLHVGSTTPSTIVLPVIPVTSDQPASLVAAGDSDQRVEE